MVGRKQVSKKSFTLFMVITLCMNILSISILSMSNSMNDGTEQVSALSFESVFKGLGQKLPAWGTLKAWAECNDMEDLQVKVSANVKHSDDSSVSIGIVNYVVYDPTDKTSVEIEKNVTLSTISLAKEITEAFTDDGWDAFVAKSVDGENYKVNVDITSGNVTKSDTCTSKDYKNLKSYFTTYSNGSGIDNKASALYDSSRVDLSGNEVTEALMDTFYKIWNPILFVISSLFNFLFIAVTACDLPFMISPVVRNIVLGIEEADSKKRRYKCIRAMVTPYALKACNCKRIGFQQINQNMEEEIENPRWGYWILWMAVMFFAVASFFMLVSTNILGYAASVATAASHSFFMKILNMF